MLGQEVTKKEVDLLISRVDVDHTGELDFGEFLEARTVTFT